MQKDQNHTDELQEARSVHDKALEAIHTANAAAVENSIQAIKALFLINGGAAIASLAFLANALEHVRDKPIDGFICALLAFACGVGAATFASCFAYLTNYFAAGVTGSMERTFTNPFLIETEKSRQQERGYARSFRISVLSAMLSFLSFCLGIGMMTVSLGEFF